jgi:hypothetical protein
MGSKITLTEWEVEHLLAKAKEAKTMKQLKAVLIALLKALPSS